MRHTLPILALMMPICASALARPHFDPASPLRALRGVRRIVFLGDSITYAGGYVDLIETYLIARYPGLRYELINVGLPSETVSGLTEPNHAGGEFRRPELRERLARVLTRTSPDLVVACYGMNDGIYYPFDEGRFRKYQDGIKHLRESVRAVGARLWLITPPPFDSLPIRASTLPAGRSEYPSGSPYVDYDDVLKRYSGWLVDRRRTGWNVADIHGPLSAYLASQRRSVRSFTLAADGVHLNETGHRIIAREILFAWGAPKDSLPPVSPAPGPGERVGRLVHERQRLLTDSWLSSIGHKRPGMPAGPPLAEAQRKADVLAEAAGALVSTPIMFPGTASDYHGYARHDFVVDGCQAVVVSPKRPRAGNPWIWRAEFFDHRPELDIALLGRGFYMAYIEVGNTFGAPSAMKHWDALYRELTTRYGLGRKPVLEGLSRGGLYVYNWAAANPGKVGVIYGDNPVCDFKSWPGGKGKGPGSPEDWRKLIRDYGFRSEAEALAYRKNPVDDLEPLSRAHVPIIHVCGDADEVVPYEENTVLLRARYEALGGTVRVIVKPGSHHHPHGLDDPTPLVDFIEGHLFNESRRAAAPAN